MIATRLFATVLLALAAACSTGTARSLAPPERTLAAYADDAQFNAALERWRAASQQQLRARREAAGAMQSAPLAMASPPAAPAPAAEAKSSLAAQDSITNVQTAGVDEGGIVKTAGDHLVILRRGRLFTVRVGSDQLSPVASIDAYAPGADPRGAWYDELLISGNTIVVVGYSYQRGGTEIGLFELAPNGALSHRATYHLRSNDYYSSRNYASRLIGSRLIFYTPLMLQPWGPTPMPAMRRWHAQLPEEFQRILPATRIYRTDDDFTPSVPLALHTVTSCDLASAPLRCDASAVLGPTGRVFYVSQGSVYVWTATGRYRPDTHATAESIASVFRIPLEGSAPSGIKTVGMPIDQLSFLEDTNHLNVLLRDSGAGESMFGAERGTARLALLRLPLAAFGDGKSAAAREFYRRLPGGQAWNLQNRHVGDWLLWGSGEQAYATRPAASDEPVALNPGHAVERIEGMGRDAVLVGNRGDELRFSAVQLERGARLAGSFGRPGARQGETRTHGFFYKPVSAREGLLGLPVLGSESPRSMGVYVRGRGAASVVFLRQRDLQFQGLGELAAAAGGQIDDGCKASCVDWYGNARPIFLGERIFALMGYELVEGSLGRGVDPILERRRVSFMPLAGARDGRPSPFQ